MPQTGKPLGVGPVSGRKVVEQLRQLQTEKDNRVRAEPAEQARCAEEVKRQLPLMTASIDVLKNHSSILPPAHLVTLRFLSRELQELAGIAEHSATSIDGNGSSSSHSGNKQVSPFACSCVSCQPDTVKSCVLQPSMVDLQWST